MFRKFHKPKTIELSCPYCGHTQSEPSLVISSFCRDCGEHFRVRKGTAVANPGVRVSGIAETRPRERVKSKYKLPIEFEEPEAEPESDAWLMTAEEKDGVAHALTHPVPFDEEEEESVGISAGAFFGLVSEEALEEELGEIDSEDGNPAPGRKSLSRGTMGTLLDSQNVTVLPQDGKMPANYVAPDKRKRRADSAADLKVRCFRCYHIQDVSRFAKSTQCERCSVYISLADYEIKNQKCHTLRTRGDITIARRGGLINNSDIACHHLTVNGVIDARIDCSGTALFRHSGTVRGQLYCQKLIVEKNCEVRFPDGVKTERGEIQGTVAGNITCSGPLRVSRSGLVDGDVIAAEIELRDNGRILGTTTIDTEVSTELPLKMGFNPTIIG